jgi:hypothetical protein
MNLRNWFLSIPLLMRQMYQISVVNMSLGIYRSSLTEGLAGTLCEIVRRLEEAGVAVICAASEYVGLLAKT